MADWTRQGITMELPHYWPGVDNIADLATKGEATVRDIEAGSAWQQGPAALRLKQDQWPASRNFIRKIPDEERSPNYVTHATCGIGLPTMGAMVTTVRNLLQYSNDLKKIVFILARVMAAQSVGDRHVIEMTPSVKYLRLAHALLFIVESHDVSTEVQGKMTTLAPEFKGSMWITRGRLRKGLPKILGVEKLPILLSSSRLAELIMIEAHQENHDGAPGTLACSRTRAWIHRGRYLA